jgi:hypothetical protein
MVQFLLHNTIVAWWCAQHGIKGPSGGAGVPAGKSPVEMEYLRWRDDGTPAAGKFEGWPKTLTEFTMLDPCCGSGHFLVAAFNLLVPLRMHEERLTATQACEAVLRDNLFGLEIDPRCTQIAAFALALAAWKYPDTGGYRSLPPLNIACSGQGVTGEKEEWLTLANGDEKLRNGMDRLYDLFQQAPHLGSLIEPRREKGNMYEAGYAELQPLLSTALTKKASDLDITAVGVAAQGITRAAELLSGRYALVATNVPYLGRGKQGDMMRKYIETHYKEGKADLATAFVLRCKQLCIHSGTMALVTPHNWHFLTTYRALREYLLKMTVWNTVARLGPNAFQDMNYWAATTALNVITAEEPSESSTVFGIDVSEDKEQSKKAARLAGVQHTPTQVVQQHSQLRNPDARITLAESSDVPLLSNYAKCLAGILNGDSPKFQKFFWEFGEKPDEWVFQQSTVGATCLYSGRELLIYFDDANGHLREDVVIRRERLHDSDQRGNSAWGKPGVCVNQMNTMPVSLYSGNKFDSNVAVISPFDLSHLAAIWCFVNSPSFRESLKRLDAKVNITNATIAKVPFDVTHWLVVGAEQYPHGLPEPFSDDPTQWLFKGDIATSTDPLQVAVARLLGYRWPEQPEAANAIGKLADSDGILCLPGVRGEAAAAERLLEALHAAYGKNWSDSVLHKQLTEAGCKAGTTLDDWLRNQFFEQHCKRFQSRPFIWHIWDGRKDGFSALVNYHNLDHKVLENLTYAYLGDWITAQSKSDKAGSDSRLGAAQELQAKLKLILAGEPPYDIFVRWKPLQEQAIGWHPDLNDGVRLNIRPFVEAGILRKKPNIKWAKDRGNEPERDKDDYPWFWSGNDPVGDRVNDVHLTNEKKQAARTHKKGAK